MNLVLPYKSSRGLELGPLDDFSREILRFAQNDNTPAVILSEAKNLSSLMRNHQE